MALRELTWKLSAKDSASAAIKSVNKEMDKTKKSLPSLSKGFESAGSKLESLGKKTGKLSKGLSKVSVALLAASTAGVKMAMDLDESIRKVTTLADKKVLPVSQIKKDVREISDATGVAQREIAEATYSALSAGIDTPDVMEFVRSGVDLARAGFTDMETVIDATTTVLNAYGEEAYEVSKIHDILVQTQDKGKISVDELGQNIGRVIPAASSLGVNLDQLGASYAILTAKGQNAQLATTNLTALLNELGKSGSTVDDALKEVAGGSFAELVAEGWSLGEVLGMVDEAAKKSGVTVKDMFGSTTAGAAALTLLSDGVDGFNSTLEEMDNATGKTAENAAAMEGDLHAVKLAVNDLKNVLIDAGVAFAPIITKVTDLIRRNVERFNSLSDSTKDFIFNAAGILAVSAPILKIFSGVASGAGKTIGVVGKLAGKVGGLTTKLGGLSGIAGTAKGALASVGGGFLSAGKMIVGAISSVATKAFAFVAANPIVLGIAAAVAAGYLLIKNWDKIKAAADKFKEQVSEKWISLKETLSETIESKVEMIKDKFESGYETVKEKWAGLKKFLRNPIKGTVDLIEKRRAARTSEKTSKKSYRVGATRISKDQDARIHKDEAILPKSTADKYRALGGTKYNIPTIEKPVAGNQMTFSPTINVSVADGANGNEIAQAVKEELELMFTKLNLQYS